MGDFLESIFEDSYFWEVYMTWFNILFIVTHVLFLLLLLFVALKWLNCLLFSREQSGCGSFAFISGCDSGFGHGAAYQLNERGVHVFAACLTQAAIQKFNDDDNFIGTAFLMDITKRHDIETSTKMIGDVVKENGLRILINNAGIGDLGPIEWMTEDDLRKISEVNLWGHVNVTKALLPLLKRAQGRVINVSSMMGRFTLAYMSGYCMSKHAFEAFSDALRLEMKPWGVTVHIIEPGLFRTNVYRNVEPFQRLWNKQSDEIKKEYAHFYEDWMKKNDPSTMDKSAGDPQRVVGAYVHAAMSNRPKDRYLLGVDAHFLSFTVGLLPTFAGDFILRLLGCAG